jgi:beta-mannosidase
MYSARQYFVKNLTSARSDATFGLSCLVKRSEMTHRSLDQGWQLKARNKTLDIDQDFSSTTDWITTKAPSTVYQTLLEAGHIPNPFYGTNELNVQWVGETDWLYKLEFRVEQSSTERFLCFDGLDTFATVWLNGTPILNSDNMFVPHRLNVTHLMQTGENELWILFESAWHKGLALQAANGGPRPLWNGDSSRLHVRKAQYHYGWDWGPKLVDLGLWRSVRLETTSASITDWHCPVQLHGDFSQAVLDVHAYLEGQLQNTQLEVALLDPEGRELERVQCPVIDGSVTCAFTQPLYTVRMRLERDNEVLDAKSQRIGVRQIRVLQEPIENQPGRSFCFEVNGIEMFLGGANWIPDDLMLARVTLDRYAQRIQQAKNANMQMLRVWGGGIYEDDTFYDLCDEMGLLVWQDFMFACGIYPAHEAFTENIRREATANIKRLRHHPSIAIWTGNNEDYQLAHKMDLYKPHLSPENNPEVPARALYESVLPALVNQFDPGRYYQPGSPFIGHNPDDPTQGDKHTWEVWGNEAKPYRNYEHLGGRFVSEFGMAAAANIETIKSVLPDREHHPWSPSFEHHTKADDGMRRLYGYIIDTQAHPQNFEDYVYATQLVQSEALDCAYRIWRRQWGYAGQRGISGALVWQLNDCWEVTSWAVIDAHAKPKPAYYTIKRALEPITINIWNDHAIWAVNTTLEPKSLQLELRSIGLDGQELAKETRTVTLQANATTELGHWKPNTDEKPSVIAVRLLENGRVIARHSLFPEPFKHFDFQNPELEIERHGNELHLKVKKPVKGVYIREEGFSHNMFDLIPGDTQVVLASRVDSNVQAQWLGGSGTIRIKSRSKPTRELAAT